MSFNARLCVMVTTMAMFLLSIVFHSLEFAVMVFNATFNNISVISWRKQPRPLYNLDKKGSCIPNS